MMRPKTTIFAVAEQAFTPRNQINCSGYVKDVAHLLGVWMPDVDANHLIKKMQSDHSWINLHNNDTEASRMAGQHFLVIAGWINSRGHGHIVVIVPGREGNHAKGYWGSLDRADKAAKDRGVNWAFDEHILHDVQYFATPVSALVTSP